MGTELTGLSTIDAGTLYAFLLVLARISGAFIFVPIPGIQAGPEIARALLAVSLTLALAPRWPVIDAAGVNFPLLMGWILAEAGMGLAVGLAVAFLAEGFQMGAQIISLQAGYTFATTIDPTSGADSSGPAHDRANHCRSALFRHRHGPPDSAGLRPEPLLAACRATSRSRSYGHAHDSSRAPPSSSRACAWCCRCWRCC